MLKRSTAPPTCTELPCERAVVDSAVPRLCWIYRRISEAFYAQAVNGSTNLHRIAVRARRCGQRSNFLRSQLRAGARRAVVRQL